VAAFAAGLTVFLKEYSEQQDRLGKEERREERREERAGGWRLPWR
jgi:hypothetical protein